MEEIKKEELIPLNEIFFDPNLSIEELEERLELAEAPWFCLGYTCEVCDCPLCEPVCDPVCDPVI